MSRWRPAHTLLVRVGPMSALPDDGLRASVGRQVTDRTAVVAEELGLPLVPQIEVALDELPGVEVGSDGQAVAASDRDLEDAWRLVAPATTQPVPFGWDWRPWAATVGPLAEGPAVVGAFVGEVVTGLLQRRPDRLFTIRQAVAYLMHHGGADSRDVDPDALLRIAAPALALGVGIGDGARVLDHLAAGHAPEPERVEALIADLRASSIDVLVAPDLAAELAGPAAGDRLRLVGDDVLAELGVRVPDLRLRPDDRLAPRCLSVRVNDLTGRPHRALRPGTVMVDAAPDELGGRFGDPEPLRHPGTGARCSAVPDDHAHALRASGRLVWDPLDHLVLTVATEIRRRAAALVDVRTVEYELALLHREAPDLVLETLDVVRPGDLTGLVRRLVREGPGVPNFRLVLDRLLAFAALADPDDRVALDDALPWAADVTPGALPPAVACTQFVRAGMADLLAHRYATESGRLPAVIVGDDVVERVRRQRAHDRDRTAGQPLTKAEIGHLHDAARRARDHAGEGPSPVLLTVADVRADLAALLADTVPDVAVLAFEELPPDVEVACCGQLALAGVEPPAGEAMRPRRSR